MATLIGAVSFWFAVAVVPAAPGGALFVGGLGVIGAVLALAGLGGAPEPLAVGVRAASLGLGGGAFLFLLWTITGNPAVAFLMPIALLGVPGLLAIPPVGEPARMATRLVALAFVAVVLIGIAVVDATIWALLAPIVPLPAIGFADVMTDRSAAVG